MSTSSINRLDESWKYIPEVSFLLPRIRICSHFSTCIVPARIHVYVWEKYKIIYFFIIWLKYIEVHRMSCRCFKSLLEEFIVAEEGIGNIVGWYIWFTLVPQFLDKHSRLCSIYIWVFPCQPDHCCRQHLKQRKNMFESPMKNWNKRELLRFICCCEKINMASLILD